MTQFTPITSALGGVLIGVAATILLMFNGRIAGISGIVAGVFPPREGDFSWRVAFVGGLLAGGVALALLLPTALRVEYAPPAGLAILAGVLVGFGTQLGAGCTSGHGVCGISRWSLRSMVATITFIATGAIAVVLMRFLGVVR